MSEPFVITVRFGPLHQILGEMRAVAEQSPVQSANRGIQHFDFDFMDSGDPSIGDTCVECGFTNDEHADDCLGAI